MHLYLFHVIQQGGMPFSVKNPKAETISAIKELVLSSRFKQCHNAP
jgi:antitoxin component of RelBE/YafQ-DinJ toxin-antitoxin module